MLAAQIARCRGIALAEHDMSDKAKARVAPCGDELVGLRPAIEADAEGIGFQDAKHAVRGGLQPFVAIVVGNALAVARAVVHQIGRIGEDEIHAVIGDVFHQHHAIAMKDCVTRRAGGRAADVRVKGH